MSARKPSDRANRNKGPEELDLTSLMDIITNLMFFLLLFSNAIAIVIIDAPLPKVASTASEVKQAKEKDNKLEVTAIIKATSVMVETNRGGNKKFDRNAKGEFDFKAMHDHFISLHQKNKKVNEITLLPDDDVPYKDMIDVMDASREYNKDDPGFVNVPPEMAGKPESLKFNRMFSQVNIGGV